MATLQAVCFTLNGCLRTCEESEFDAIKKAMDQLTMDILFSNYANNYAGARTQ